MRDDEAPGPLTQASAPKAPGRPGRRISSEPPVRDTIAPGMIAAGVENEVSRHSAGYWRDLVFGRVLPAVFFSVFLVRDLLTLSDGLHSIRQPSDYLFVVQQGLALAYFTMLVVLYSVRLPKRGTDHRLGFIFIAFTGTFSGLAASFFPGGAPRHWLGPPAVIIATPP